MSPRVAERSVMSEHTPRPTTASVDEHVERQAHARRRRDVLVGDLQGGRGRHRARVELVPRTSLGVTPNHSEAIRRATGAAAASPKPPFSIVTVISIGRVESGM